MDGVYEPFKIFAKKFTLKLINISVMMHVPVIANYEHRNVVWYFGKLSFNIVPCPLFGNVVD